MGAFLVFVGLCLVAWSIYFVGRRIARVLWGILCVIENDKDQKAIFEEQKKRMFD